MRVSGDAFSIPTTHGADDRALRARRAQRQMPRVNSSFIQYPRVSIVNSFHAPSQQATRSDQKRRNNVAKNRRTKQTHKRKLERPVVVHWPNQDQLLNSVGI